MAWTRFHSCQMLLAPFFFFFFLRFYLFIFIERGREGEREEEKHTCVVISCTSPTGDPARNPGMCPDWESNWRHFGLQTGTQSTEPHQPELFGFCMVCIHLFSQETVGEPIVYRRRRKSLFSLLTPYLHSDPFCLLSSTRLFPVQSGSFAPEEALTFLIISCPIHLLPTFHLALPSVTHWN